MKKLIIVIIVGFVVFCFAGVASKQAQKTADNNNSQITSAIQYIADNE